jgi:hypothetical protein
MRAIGFQGQGGMLYRILVAIGGAVLLTWLYRLILAPRASGGAASTNIEEEEKHSNLRKVA